ncbi:Radical SAM protein [Sulfidibacter corallicola]|uniref:Radical SAM protein n=1 Tax=Sulfidibacter corallicola TaxID=2818388 RepID=A0A8A4TK79_SULCO|nr:radical SAM protein [Sulfidibacter corallicola]QTD50346.1 radical SAM protein [Sulfidibacter corallicola]
MRVAFLKPPIGGILGLEMLTFVEPLGAECVAGSLEQDGHQCAIFDLRLEGEQAGLEKCRDWEPRIVGLQCNFTTERYPATRIAKRVKELMPDAFVLVGGHDASREPNWFDDACFDAIAVGDGEEIMPAMVDAMESGQDLKKVPGLVLHKDGQMIATGCAPTRKNLDELPIPARHLIEDYADKYYINFRKPLALMETARGCPYRCNFCSVWKFHQKRFREKSPERVVQELSQIKAPNVFITDDIFWLDARRGLEMARLIKEAGIKKFFTVQTRTDIICRRPDLIEAWKDCGHLSIFLGVEAVDDDGLAHVNKKNSASNNKRALEILKELGVGFTSNFIVDPNWDHDDFARLRQWIEKMGAYNSGFSVLTPLPGTDLWESAKNQVTTHNWEMYDIIHAVLPTRLSLEEFYEEYAKLWQTALEVRYRMRGKLRSYVQLGAALATGKVSLDAVKKGMNIAKVFSKKETFLEAHTELAVT